MDILEAIKRKLEVLGPKILEVQDQSNLHKGHGGYKDGQVTHVKIVISGKVFVGKTRLERQKELNKRLNREIAKIHAISYEFK